MPTKQPVITLGELASSILAALNEDTENLPVYFGTEVHYKEIDNDCYQDEVRRAPQGVSIIVMNTCLDEPRHVDIWLGDHEDNPFRDISEDEDDA